jgi:hypothetical protein
LEEGFLELEKSLMTHIGLALLDLIVDLIVPGPKFPRILLEVLKCEDLLRVIVLLIVMSIVYPLGPSESGKST